MLIPNWQRLIGMYIYMLPWSEAIPFGSNLFVQIPLLKWLTLPTLPFLVLETAIPFGSLILFITLFLAVIRNPKIPYFLRYNTLQAILFNIAIYLMRYAFQIIINPLGNGLIVRTLYSTVFIGALTIVIFAIGECLQGKEPDFPGFSEAVKMQL